ncbi:hypothetical protein J14TS2_13100 [Bacillus sp. J14TS2]|nr:hypothetical protein J14TS2_13100 [Bacillus sp. J14TS2]
MNAALQERKAENEAAKNSAIKKAQESPDLSEKSLNTELQKQEKTERNTNLSRPSIF